MLSRIPHSVSLPQMNIMKNLKLRRKNQICKVSFRDHSFDFRLNDIKWQKSCFQKKSDFTEKLRGD